MCWVSWGLEMWGPNVDLSPSSCCPPSNGWVSAPGFSTPYTLTTRETPLLSTSPLRFTFCPSITLPPICSRTHQTILWDWETSLMPRTASNWLRSRRIRLVCRAIWPFALHISQGGPGFLRENGRGSCKGVENLQKAGKLSSLLLVPAPHFTWKSIIMIMQWFWLCRRGVCTR